ncbi:MAG: hypothetical protein WB770_00500 [Acidimicrobiales bacterium]
MAAQRLDQPGIDPSLKAIFDDLTDGVLVVDVAGHRIYSNPALDDLVGANACLPLYTPDPPPYVPVDERHKYVATVDGIASLLSVEGFGTASTRFDLIARGGRRIRVRLKIIALSNTTRESIVVCLLMPELRHDGDGNIESGTAHGQESHAPV